MTKEMTPKQRSRYDLLLSAATRGYPVVIQWDVPLQNGETARYTHTLNILEIDVGFFDSDKDVVRVHGWEFPAGRIPFKAIVDVDIPPVHYTTLVNHP